MSYYGTSTRYSGRIDEVGNELTKHMAASAVHGPVTWRACRQLAGVCHWRGESVEAEALWRRTVTQRPTWRPARSGLANVLFTQRRWADLEAIALPLESMPDAAGEAAWWRGRRLLDQGDATIVVASRRTALVDRPEDVSLALLHACTLGEAGNLIGAESGHRRVRQMRPEDAWVGQEWETLQRRIATRLGIRPGE